MSVWRAQKLESISIVTACAPQDVGFLAGAYESLRSQTFTNWEWVLQEDGEQTIPSEFVTQDKRISYRANGQRLGVAITRNKAIFRSRMEVIRNLDADDELANETTLERTIRCYAQPKVTYSVGAMIDILEDGSIRQFQDRIAEGFIEPGSLFDGWLTNNFFGLVHPTSVSFRRSMVMKYGPYPALEVSEDTAFLLPISQAEWGWFDSEPVTRHRKRAASITGSSGHRSDEEVQQARQFIIDRCKYLSQNQRN